MALITDGDRSLSRLWFGKKLLRTIKMIGLNVKSSMFDGFFFRASTAGGLDKIIIKAPMGAVVVCSTPDSVKLMTADYWLSGFSAARDIYTGEPVDPGAQTVFYKGGEANREIPALSQIDSPYGYPYEWDNLYPWDNLINPNTFPDLTGSVDNSPPSAILSPMAAGEGFFLSTTMRINTEAGRNFKGKAEILMMNYRSSGNTETRYSVIYQSDIYFPPFVNGFYNYEHFSFNDSVITIFNLPPGDPQVEVNESFESITVAYLKRFVVSSKTFPVIGNKLTLAQYWKMSPLAYKSQLIYATDVYMGIPSPAYHTLVVGTIYNNEKLIYPGGIYAFQSTTDKDTILLVHTVARGLYLINECVSSPVLCGEYISFYTFYNCDNDEIDPVHVTFSQISGLCYHMIYDDRTEPYPMPQTLDPCLNQIFPYPNRSCDVPHDSIMFHTHDDNVYSWSREYGFIKISMDGIFLFMGDGHYFIEHEFVIPTVPELTYTKVDSDMVYLPSIVETTSGMKPEISFSGMDPSTGENIYTCVCIDQETSGANREVVEIYKGSPFVGWSKITWDVNDFTIRKVRIVNATSTNMKVLGIIETENGYRMAYLDTELNKWNPLGGLDIPITNDPKTWDVCLFGEGSFVQMLNEYPSQEPSTQQMPVSPYSGYAATP